MGIDSGPGTNEGGIIRVTRQDINNAWMKNAPMGIDVGSESVDDVRILHKEFSGRVYFSESYKGWAAYDTTTNGIVVGENGLRCGDGVLGAMLRHEKSHFVFANMGQEMQEELVDNIWNNNQPQLAEFYAAIRTAYKADYFSSERAQRKADLAATVGRGHLYNRMEYIIYDGVAEEVDLTTLIDEMVAFSVSLKGGNEFLPDGKGWQETFDKAAEIVNKLDLTSKGIIDRTGFGSIESWDLLQDLKNDEDFVLAQVVTS